jgi:hypothetical protein
VLNSEGGDDGSPFLNKPQSRVLGDSFFQAFLSFVAFWSLSIVAVLPIQRSLSDLCTN